MQHEVNGLRIDVDFVLKNNIIAWSDQKSDFLWKIKQYFIWGLGKISVSYVFVVEVRRG